MIMTKKTFPSMCGRAGQVLVAAMDDLSHIRILEREATLPYLAPTCYNAVGWSELSPFLNCLVSSGTSATKKTKVYHFFFFKC